MKQESKLEQAAEQYAQPKIVSDDFIYPQSALTKIKKETFITAVKSEAAKQYWQSLTTPAGNEHLFRWVNMEVRLPKEGVEVFFDGGENPPMFGSIKYNGKHPSILVYDSSGEEEYLPVSDYEQWLEAVTPSKPHTVEEAGQTQEPVGGMKWEDVQILAKKHAEHIIEMGWRDNPDKDDIIADFISGYASAPPPAPIKTEGEDEKINLDINKHIESCFQPIATLVPPPSPVGIDVDNSIEKLANDYAETFHENILNVRAYNNYNDLYKSFKAGYSASLPQSTGYTKYQILQAAKDAEVSMIDAEHIVSILEKESQSSTEEEKDREGDAVDGWISVEDRPLFTKDENDIWTLTNDGEKDFIAAVPYNDATKPNENNLWWIRHCIIDDGGLKVVGDDDNEPAGWSLTDVTHYIPFPKSPIK